MKNLNQLLKKLEKNFNQLEKNLLKLKSLWLRAKKLLEQFLVIALILVPALSFSQSKNEYPKQTTINGQKVVILKLEQAIEMNESFLEMQAKIDSINNHATTLETVVVRSEDKRYRTQHDLNELVYKMQAQRRYYLKQDLKIAGGFLIVASIGFTILTLVN